MLALALTAALALQLAGSPYGPPSAPPPPPPAASQRAWDDDAGDLARLGRLAATFDLAVLRRDLALLRRVEGRVLEEVAAELDEARRERRRGTGRRVGALEKARRAFDEARERTDARSLERKRSALADLSQAAWAELVAAAGGHERWKAARDAERDRERDRAWESEWHRAWALDRPEDRRDDRRDERIEDRRDERRDERRDDRRDERRDERRDDRRDDRASRDDRDGWRPPPGPPTPPPAPAVLPMRADRFEALQRAMGQESFSDGRLRVLDTALAASDDHLSVEQVGRLLGLFSFSQEQLALVRLVRPRLADPEQGFRLHDRFTFASDKEELRRILQP